MLPGTHTPSFSAYTLSLLVAYQIIDRGMGYKGRLPWHLKQDLEHFHHTVSDKIVIMGRKTFESMGKPLAQARENIIVSSTLPPSTSYTVCSNLAHLYSTIYARTPNIPLCIIGGSSLFQIFFPHCTTLLQTLVTAHCKVDAFFPMLPLTHFQIAQEQHILASKENTHAYTIQTLQRRAWDV